MKGVKGARDLQKKLTKLSDKKIYYQALGQSAAIVEGAAIREVPVDTGLLRNSINTQVNVEDLTATVGTNLEYAPYVEYGTGILSTKGGGRNTPWSYQKPDGSWVTTSGQRAQPFLGPALRKNKKVVRAKFKEIVSGVLAE